MLFHKLSSSFEFHYARFVFRGEEAPKATPEQAAEKENEGYKLQTMFSKATEDFRRHVKDATEKAKSLDLRGSIRAYKEATSTLASTSREIGQYLEKHPDQKFTLNNVDGGKLNASEVIGKGRSMTTLEWADVLGIGREAEEMRNQMDRGAHALIEKGNSAIDNFELKDAKSFQAQIDSAKDFDSLDAGKSAFDKATQVVAEYKQSARELSNMFGRTSPMGEQFAELERKADALQKGTLTRLEEAYAKKTDAILAEKTGAARQEVAQETPSEKALRTEMAKATAAAEGPEKPHSPPFEQAEGNVRLAKAPDTSIKEGWDASSGRFFLSPKEFKNDTLGKYFSEKAIRVDGKVALRANPDDVKKNKNLRTGEYYYADARGGMTSRRALLTPDTVVTKDVPENFAKAAPEKASESFDSYLANVKASLESKAAAAGHAGPEGYLASRQFDKVVDIEHSEAPEAQKRAEIERVLAAKRPGEFNFKDYVDQVRGELEAKGNATTSPEAHQLIQDQYDLVTRIYNIRGINEGRKREKIAQILNAKDDAALRKQYAFLNRSSAPNKAEEAQDKSPYEGEK